ncbi:DNA-binding protein [Clostridium aminobutyricum]|uniref:DNA-binding protein n=2 Tax=Clostridium aminobutyricum TaxID=33953 RepID=A0A939D6Q7_CLOAM|nr:DNA-binding protein [Clostridium aminobutyricum]MBN7772262.1 DNA-binding protein [Clostridium aminobutyricum]
MEYISTKEAAEKWSLTPRMVVYHCVNGRIKGAQKIANVWIIPKDAARPEDRRKAYRIGKGGGVYQTFHP